MVRNLILGIVVVMLSSIVLLSCGGGLSPGVLPPVAWSYPWPTRIHVAWDANTETDMYEYRIYRYSIRHNITDYSTLAVSITPYVADLIDQIEQDTDDPSAFAYLDSVNVPWAQYDDWSIQPKFVYGYVVTAVDVAGNESDPSDDVYTATP
jgi:hypothetical protein